MHRLLWFRLRSSCKSAKKDMQCIWGRRCPDQYYIIGILKQNYDIHINGLTPPPEDEHGLDIPRILHHPKRQSWVFLWGCREVKCWSAFSFSQFVMWNDIIIIITNFGKQQDCHKGWMVQYSGIARFKTLTNKVTKYISTVAVDASQLRLRYKVFTWTSRIRKITDDL